MENIARKHSSRMRTACLPTIHASVATSCQHDFEQVSSSGHSMSLAGGGPQVKKFDQVSSLDHRMSLVGKAGARGVPIK